MTPTRAPRRRGPSSAPAICSLTSCLPACCTMQDRFVPPTVHKDALVRTVPFLHSCSGTSNWAHLLSKEQHGQVLLYGAGDEDEAGLPQRAVLAVHLEQLGGMMAAKRCQLRTVPQLNAFESELRRCAALPSVMQQAGLSWVARMVVLPAPHCCLPPAAALQRSLPYRLPTQPAPYRGEQALGLQLRPVGPPRLCDHAAVRRRQPGVLPEQVSWAGWEADAVERSPSPPHHFQMLPWHKLLPASARPPPPAAPSTIAWCHHAHHASCFHCTLQRAGPF